MTFANDLADDADTFDGHQSVTFHSLSAAGDVSVVVAGALVRTIDTGEAARERSLLRRRRAVLHLTAAGLQGVVPKCGDVVVDAAAARWRVTAARLETLAMRHRLECVEER